MSSRILFASASLTVLVVAIACPEPTVGPTYHQDIAPLLADRCTSCHQDGGIGPFPLTTYEDAKANALAMAYATEARLMPPSPVDTGGSCRDFIDSKWLTDEEIETFRKWADNDAPEGAKPEEELSLTPPDTLDDPNLFVEMPEPYTPQGSAEHAHDDYRCFLLSGPEADGFLTAFEILPGAPQEVHHMLLFSPLTDAAEARFQNLDDESAEPGFECFNTPIVDEDTSFIAAWAPGSNTWRYPESTGLPVAGGRPLVMQIHYNLLAGAGVPDVTSLKLRTVPTVQKQAAMLPIVDTDLNVPPGLPDASYGFSIPLAGLPDDLDVWAVMPHMHQLGQTLRFDLHPLGSESPDDNFCMTDVPRWDFHWQQMYQYKDPIRVTAADVLNVKCTFDTRDRTEPVTWGEGTEDEMCLVFVYVTRPSGASVYDLLEDL